MHHVPALTLGLVLLAPLALPARGGHPLATSAPAREPPPPTEDPASGSAFGPEGPSGADETVLPVDLPSVGLSDEYVPPFDADSLTLAKVLQEASTTNIDLSLNSVDVQISEAQVMAALGAFDVFINAGVDGSITETPQRGSQFAFSLGERTLSGNLGFTRQLETGGEISLNVQAVRSQSQQPANFFDTSLGSTTLSRYSVIPTLRLTHPLLKGAGVKVNRAPIDKAKIATTQAEATRQLTSQNLARDLISAYWDVLFAHRDLENKRRTMEFARRQLERNRALVAAGRLSPVEVKAVEQDLAQRESDVLNAENALLDNSLTLRTFMGQQFADRKVLGVLPTTDPVVKPRRVDVSAELDQALKANPQVRQLELALASLRIDELVAANARLPQLDFTGSFTPQGRSVDTNADPLTGDPGREATWAEAFRNIFNEDVESGLLADWTLTGSLTLTWDVQNRGPKGQHEVAKLQIKRSEVQLAQVRQTVAAAVIRAANSLRTAGKVIEVSRISYELAEDNLEAEQARFDVGRSTNFDVLQRLDELDTAAASALSAQISYLKALVQLQALTGEILPAYGLDATAGARTDPGSRPTTAPRNRRDDRQSGPAPS